MAENSRGQNFQRFFALCNKSGDATAEEEFGDKDKNGIINGSVIIEQDKEGKLKTFLLENFKVQLYPATIRVLRSTNFMFTH